MYPTCNQRPVGVTLAELFSSGYTQGCRGYGDSHGYGHGMGMGIKIQFPRQPWVY